MPHYSAKALDHFRRPRNVGVIEDADAVGSVSNPQCGDTMKLYLRIREGRVAGARWQARGCSASIAAGSAASELITGQTIEGARALTRGAIVEALDGLPPSKAHGALLAVDAIREALRRYEATRPGDAPGAAQAPP